MIRWATFNPDIGIKYFKLLNFAASSAFLGITTTSSVGVGRFELPTSSSRTMRANRAALHPENRPEFNLL